MLRRLLLTTVLVAGVLGGLVEGGTLSYLTSTTTSTGNQFTAGAVTLAANIASGDTLSVSNLVPGDSFIAQLTVQNSGNLDLKYTVSTSTTGNATLAGTLQLAVRLKIANPCSTDFTGAVLYATGNLDVASVAERSLAAGATENLCFKVELPSSASVSLRGTSVVATFNFAAKQASGT